MTGNFAAKPLPQDAAALYPNLDTDAGRLPASDPDLQVVSFFPSIVSGSELSQSAKNLWNYKVPLPAPASPQIVVPALPGRRGMPVPRLPGVGVPVPPPPAGAPLFQPVDPRSSSSPPPFPLPPQAGPKILTTPSQAPEVPRLEGIVPLKPDELGRQIIGGGFPLPKHPDTALPGFSIPEADAPGRTLILEMELSEARVLPNGRRQLTVVDFDKLKKSNPHFGFVDELYQEAGKRTTKQGGASLGTEWHVNAEKVLKEQHDKGKWTDVRAEVSWIDGKEDQRRGEPGTARLDLYWQKGDTLFIVDLKTGGATLSASQISHILRNVRGKVTNVVVYQYKP